MLEFTATLKTTFDLYAFPKIATTDSYKIATNSKPTKQLNGAI